MTDTHVEHIAADADHCPIMPTYGPPEIMFVRGEGSRLYDPAGKEYIDWLAGIAVTSLGHSHPGVAKAIAEQATTLLHVSNLFATEPQWKVARIIDELVGGPAGQVFFCNSGGEANEALIKLARKWGGRGRHVVVSAMRSFHGRTLATLAATGQPEKHEPFQPLPEGFRHVEYNNIDALEQSLDDTVAAVLLEPIQGEGGINEVDPGYFPAVRELCTERGILLMFDEVQTGLARTGAWFAHQHYGIEPDAISIAKALGNGMPIGAIWARNEVAASFKPGDHATTFGGQPMAASAALATLADHEVDRCPITRQHRRLGHPRQARGNERRGQHSWTGHAHRCRARSSGAQWPHGWRRCQRLSPRRPGPQRRHPDRTADRPTADHHLRRDRTRHGSAQQRAQPMTRERSGER